jgi:hypothetical protein
VLLHNFVKGRAFLGQLFFEPFNLRNDDLIFFLEVLDRVPEMLVLFFQTLDHFLVVGQHFFSKVGQVALKLLVPITLTFQGLSFHHIDEPVLFLNFLFKLKNLLLLDLLFPRKHF